MTHNGGWRTQEAIVKSLQLRIQRDPASRQRPIWETALEQMYEINPQLRPNHDLEPLGTILPRVMDTIAATETT